MMLSSADFEDLFPHIFGPARPEIARWEDDEGSRIGVGSCESKSGLNLVKPAKTYLPPPHAQAALIAMRVGAAWAKLAPFGHGAHDHRVETPGGA